jgi:tRNA A37 threonylcarbamoyltransferase TsaD
MLQTHKKRSTCRGSKIIPKDKNNNQKNHPKKIKSQSKIYPSSLSHNPLATNPSSLTTTTTRSFSNPPLNDPNSINHLQNLSQATSKKSPSNFDQTPFVVLGIETSCDDTSLAIVSSDRQTLTTQSISQLGLHQLHGGVVPTIAMRSHAITINHLIAKSLLAAHLISTPSPHLLPQNSNIFPTFSPTSPIHSRFPTNSYLEDTTDNCTWLESELHKLDQFRQHLFLRCRVDSPTPKTSVHPSLQLDLDAIAFTLGPGLSGSLAVGVDTAKALGTAFNLPIIPVNHLIAHTTVGQLTNKNVGYPYFGLIISGGHTQLNYVKDEQTVTVLASTVDDAIGEAFDKIYRSMDMEAFDFEQTQKVIKKEQINVAMNLFRLKDLWPENLEDEIKATGNELLADVYRTIMSVADHDPGENDLNSAHTAKNTPQTLTSSHHTGATRTNQSHSLSSLSSQYSGWRIGAKNDLDQSQIPNSELLEQFSLQFLQNLQQIPDLTLERVSLPAVGNVNDLYNTNQTPDAFLPTFQEAYVRVQNQKKSSRINNTHSIISTKNPNDQNIDTSKSDPSDPSVIDNYNDNDDDDDDNDNISDKDETPSPEDINMSNLTPKSERQVLEALSTHKTLPHGAQVEIAANMYTDMYNILQAYDFMILNITQNLTHNLQCETIRKRFFEKESNRGFGVLRKAGQLLPVHRFLPIVPLPLPLHLTNKDQSYTSLSYSGFKTKIRQHIATEIDFMNSIEIFASQHDLNTKHVAGLDEYPNPYDRSEIQSFAQIPPYLTHLTHNSSQRSSLSTQVSNIYRLCVSAQFQMTGTEHLIQKISRSMQYMHNVFPNQDGVYIMDKPQSLDQLILPPNDGSFHVGHSTHDIPNEQIWKKHTKSLLQAENKIVIGGGVACNKYITENIKLFFQNFNPNVLTKPKKGSNMTRSSSEQDTEALKFDVVIVPPQLCADNGSMIAWSGIQKYKKHLDQFDQFCNHSESDNGHNNYDFSQYLASSHVIDSESLQHQQNALDRHFIQLYGRKFEEMKKRSNNNHNDQTDSLLPNSLALPANQAEEFSILYQRPKWPLHEVFIPKPSSKLMKEL